MPSSRRSAFHDEHAELREVLHDIADERGEINRRRLGWWIRRHAGRIVDGRRFVRASGNRSAEAWQVESVSPVSSVSNAPSEKSVSGGTDNGNASVRAKPLKTNPEDGAVGADANSPPESAPEKPDTPGWRARL